MSESRHVAATGQAAYGDVLANREYRALYGASAISWLGDFLARAAVTALVFTTTKSVILSASAFAVGYLPGLTCGPFLAAAAERYANRRVMIVCDVVRAGLIALVALPGLPIGALLALLFATTLLNAPFDASRSALLPRIVSGDEYVVAVSLQNTTNNIAQVTGYFVGGAVAPFYPHAALLLDATTFLLSALLIKQGVKPRELLVRGTRRSLVRETAAGFHLVFTEPVLRAIAVLVFGAWTFAVVPEGLAAAWAGELAHDASGRGVDQALIMISIPIGTVIGSLVVARLVEPDRRRRLIRPLSLAVPLALTPTLLNPPAVGVAILAGVCGVAIGGLIPPANGLFVQALPGAFRARAFGVMQFGLQLVQAVALFATGAVADRVALFHVVGWWSVGGVCVMLVAGLLWPSSAKINETLARVRLENDATAASDAASTSDAATTSPDRHATRPSPAAAAPRQAPPLRASIPAEGAADDGVSPGDQPFRNASPPHVEAAGQEA